MELVSYHGFKLCCSKGGELSVSDSKCSDSTPYLFGLQRLTETAEKISDHMYRLSTETGDPVTCTVGARHVPASAKRTLWSKAVEDGDKTCCGHLLFDEDTGSLQLEGVQLWLSIDKEGGISFRSHVRSWERYEARHASYAASVQQSLQQCTYVPKGWVAVEGMKIKEDMVIGKQLSCGKQGCIFLVMDRHGNERQDVLLKVLKDVVLSTGDLHKEWAIGHMLNALADHSTGSIPGFIRTFDILFFDHKPMKVAGILLERLHGVVLKDNAAGLLDISYIQDLLRQVLGGLAAAERLGFAHNDLQMGNIFEHHPPANPGAREFKIIDYGMATVTRTATNKVFELLSSAIFCKARHSSAIKQMDMTHLPFSINPQHGVHLLAKGVYQAGISGKGDVHHVLASAQKTLDNRCWAKEDEEQVEMFAEMVKDVTGIRLNVQCVKGDRETLRQADCADSKLIGPVASSIIKMRRFRKRALCWFPNGGKGDSDVSAAMALQDYQQFLDP